MDIFVKKIIEPFTFSKLRLIDRGRTPVARGLGRGAERARRLVPDQVLRLHAKVPQRGPALLRRPQQHRQERLRPLRTGAPRADMRVVRVQLRLAASADHALELPVQHLRRVHHGAGRYERGFFILAVLKCTKFCLYGTLL